MSILEKLRTIVLLRKTYKNWITIVLSISKYRRYEDTVEVIIPVLPRNGKEASIPLPPIFGYAYAKMFQNSKISKLNINEASLNFAYEETPLNFKAIDYGPVVDVFFHNTYGFLQVVDEVVVDIGANVGDSSIYFALKGASRVIAVEPYPFTYNFASRNINSNKFQDKILLINSGYGRDHLARVNDKVISLGHSELKESSNGHDVQILSLKTIISTYDITCGILKMDCEGCEYNLLEESCDTLRIFKMIQLEYHYNQGGLVDKLESCGFKVRLTEPRKMTNKTALNPNCKVGYIYAEISDLKR